MQDYFGQVVPTPGILIWSLVRSVVPAKADMLRDITTRAAVAAIMSFFMVFLLYCGIVNLSF
jgi:hypothetical protein